MLTHDELLAMWEQDAPIDKLELDSAATEAPKLHHKYLSMLMNLKAKKIAISHQLEDLKRTKELYYSGQATSDVYKEQPFDLKLKTKAGVEKHVNTDPAVVQIEQKIEYINILLEGLNHILEQVKWRNQSIKNAIDWIRFTSGSL